MDFDEQYQQMIQKHLAEALQNYSRGEGKTAHFKTEFESIPKLYQVKLTLPAQQTQNLQENNSSETQQQYQGPAKIINSPEAVPLESIAQKQESQILTTHSEANTQQLSVIGYNTFMHQTAINEETSDNEDDDSKLYEQKEDFMIRCDPFADEKAEKQEAQEEREANLDPTHLFIKLIQFNKKRHQSQFIIRRRNMLGPTNNSGNGQVQNRDANDSNSLEQEQNNQGSNVQVKQNNKYRQQHNQQHVQRKQYAGHNHHRSAYQQAQLLPPPNRRSQSGHKQRYSQQSQVQGGYHYLSKAQQQKQYMLQNHHGQPANNNSVIGGYHVMQPSGSSGQLVTQKNYTQQPQAYYNPTNQGLQHQTVHQQYQLQNIDKQDQQFKHQ